MVWVMLLALLFEELLLRNPLLLKPPLIETHAGCAHHHERCTEVAGQIWVLVLDRDLENERKHNVVHSHQCAWAKRTQLQSVHLNKKQNKA